MAARPVLARVSFVSGPVTSRPGRVRPKRGLAVWIAGWTCVFLACSSPKPDASTRRSEAPAVVEAKPVSVAAAGSETAVADEAPAVPTEPPPPAEPAPPVRASALEMTFVGDIIFGRYREAGFDPIPEDGFDVFGPMREALGSDMLVGNLETPLVYDLPQTSPIGSKFRFGGSKAHAQLLVEAGFAAVSLANNHWYDMRLQGVEETPRILDELGIVPLGAPTPDDAVFRVQSVQREGWKVGFLAFTNRSNAPQRDGVPTLPFLLTRDVPKTLVPIVEAAREHHDLVIAFVHWGEEYEDGPNGTQKKAAHALIDAGADLVIAHHPHVLQGVETYGKGLIAYSMGNFLFENTNDPARLTGVLRVRVRDSGCRESVTFHPAYVKRMPVQHPVPAGGYMGKKVRERVRLVGKRFGAVWTDVEHDERIDLKLDDPSGCSAPQPAPE